MLIQSERLSKNNFDLLRLLLAGTVCLVHSYELSGNSQLEWIVMVLSSAVAVKAFFVVSGFLIFMSYERSTSLKSFASKRTRRIYPAYFCVILLCATGLWLVRSEDAGAYFSTAWIKYLICNLTFLNFLQPSLPGVFETNKLNAVNGALWTLKVEVLFYLSVPLLVAMLRRWSNGLMLALLYSLSIAYAYVMTMQAQRSGANIYNELARQLPGQLCYFLAGAYFFYFLPLFERRAALFMIAAILVLVASRFVPLGALEPFALATIVVFFALFCYVGHFGKYGDFSFGVYILHFPIIQLLLHSGYFRDKPWLFLAAVISATAVGAVAMWHLVEKRFLPRSSHYITESASA